MKRCAAGVLLLLLMAALLWDTQTVARAARDGLDLCARSVVPALFPFFVAVSCFTDLGLADSLGRFLSPVLGPLLGCSGPSSTAFLLGLLGGYPVGARAVAQLYELGSIRRDEAVHLLSFCNNCGPAFVLGVAGAGCFGSLRTGLWLYLIHLAAAVLVAVLHRPTNAPAARPVLPPPAPPVSAAFLRAVIAGAETMLHVCAFVVFFMVALRLLCAHTGLDHPLLLGAVELTGGILSLAPDRAGFLMAAALLGWGGLSVHCQTAAVLRETDLPPASCLRGKLLQSLFSAALALPVSRWLF